MEFFPYENQREPPSIADWCSLRSGKKSDILQSFSAPEGSAAAAKHATVTVLDMATVTHMVHPTNAKTFSKYVTLNILPFLESQMNAYTQHFDAVWANYPEENDLKGLTHKDEEMAHGQEFVMAVLQSQSMNGAVVSWKMREQKGTVLIHQ